MTFQRISETSVPEVASFVESANRIEDFVKSHAKVFSQFRELVEDHNQKLQAADAAVRQRDVSCGPWDKYAERINWDENILFESLGKDEFLNLGGKIETVQRRTFNKDKAEALAKSGQLPPNVVAAARSVVAAYHAPKKMSA